MKKMRLANRLFEFGDWLGVHILPAHFYSPVPRRKWLRRNEHLWRRPSSLPGVGWNIDDQAAWLASFAGKYPAELPLHDLYAKAEAVGGLRFGPIESQLLYAFIRTTVPRRIVELGSGSSTMVMSMAVSRNQEEGRGVSEIWAFDPYSANLVAHLPHVTAKSVGAQELTAEDLALSAGDLLFIDTTHAVRTGSEVPHLYIEVLPLLPPGVTIHIHDIHLPYLYKAGLYNDIFDWQETTLVAALLSGSSKFSVLAATSALHHAAPDVLRAIFPEYRPRRFDRGLSGPSGDGHYPASLWLRT